MLNKLTRFLLILSFILQLVACAGIQENSDGSSISDKTYISAIAAMKAGKLKKAQNLFTEVIKQHPEIANAQVNLGIIFIEKESYDEAEKAFNQALQINASNIYALNQLGFLYRKQGEFAKAKSSYEKAISINSSYAYAHLNLGILYDLYLYDLEKAIEQYKVYNQLSDKEDSQVVKWIVELERRHKKSLDQGK